MADLRKQADMAKRISRRKCSVVGCDRPVESHGFCQPHWRRVQLHGDPGPAEIASRTPNKGRVCAIEGCPEPAHHRGWCSRHYRRWHEYGDPLAPLRPPPPTVCVVGDCPKPPVSRAMCEMHYTRWRKYGDPLVVNPDRRADDEVTYFSFHARIRKARGKASEHRCVKCPGVASDWAYIHETNPRDVNSYMPLCRRCHSRYDYDQKVVRWTRQNPLAVARN